MNGQVDKINKWIGRLADRYAERQIFEQIYIKLIRYLYIKQIDRQIKDKQKDSKWIDNRQL